MKADEWTETIRLIPEIEHGKLVIVLLNGTEICIDTIACFEAQYLVVRGRQGGTIEESRGFIVPYDQFLCLRFDRAVKVEELQGFFGESKIVPVNTRDSGTVARSTLPTPTVPSDPAIASKLMMERIRAMRASSAR
jgi:hypothetical protein